MDTRENTNKPALPDYTGPNEGWAYWVHHKEPIEYCYNFAGRVAFILAEKPKHEQAVRLAALTRIPDRLIPEDLRQATIVYTQAGAALRQVYLNRTSRLSASEAYRSAAAAAQSALGHARLALDRIRNACEPTLLASMSAFVPPHLWRVKELVFPSAPPSVKSFYTTPPNYKVWKGKAIPPKRNPKERA